ncbi:MAG: hypothetical protein CMO01_12095 [Thalassobius sp.]|nr:hypothetical protein [Thalassovita sp.]
MQDRVTYEYAVIRLVPKVEREEFINIGVMIFSKPKRYIGIKYKIDEKKVKAFSEDLDIDTITSYLKAWEDVCEGAPKGGSIGEFDMASRFRWLTASRSTIIQSSKTHIGMCTNPAEVLQDLYEYYVL